MAEADTQTTRRSGDSTLQDHLLITGGEVVERGRRRFADIMILDGRIHLVKPSGTLIEEPSDEQARAEPFVRAKEENWTPQPLNVLDATGCVVASGFVDLFARLGEPGNEEAEIVLLAAAAAVRGGFTAVLAQPDTDPPLDRMGQLAELRRLGEHACNHVIPAGTITAERAGHRLSPMAELSDAGVRWFTDVGHVADIGLLRRALAYAGPLRSTVSVRPATSNLGATAAMHEGAVSARMGLAGEPAASEELAAGAAVGVARLVGGRLHLDRISAARTVDLVRAAKAEGLDISASVTAEHLLFIDADADGYDTLMRAEPPYRAAADRAALIAGVNDRTIDAVVSGHSPASSQAKDLPFDEAPPGVAALETCAAIVLGHPEIGLEAALDALSWRPAELAGATHLGGGSIEPGQRANLVVLDLDLDRPWTLGQRGSKSMARNNPHLHREMTTLVRDTVVDGRHVMRAGHWIEDDTPQIGPVTPTEGADRRRGANR